MNENCVIEFENISKAFGDNVVYQGMNLSIHCGETMTIIGGSGTGKSVTLKMLIGLMKPDEGRVLVHGEDVVPKSEEEMMPIRRKIGMLFQGSALFDSMTVGENIAYPLVEHLQLPEDQVEQRVAHKLELVALPGIEDMMPSDLSGGMKKRVALARAIAMEPEIILYDEPTTGLDPANTLRINELIIDMQHKLEVTSIVVTHDMASALMVSDRIAMLHDRKIATVKTKEEIESSEDSLIRDFIDGKISS